MATEIEELKAKIKKLEKKLKDKTLNFETELEESVKLLEECQKMMKKSIANKDDTIRDLEERIFVLQGDLQNGLKKQIDDFKSGILAEAEKIRLEYRNSDRPSALGVGLIGSVGAFCLSTPFGLLLGPPALTIATAVAITKHTNDMIKLQDKYKEYIKRYPDIQFPPI